MKNVEIYRGVPLTNGRTSEMIDTIIEKRDSMGANELAELLGLETFRPLVGIFRLLNKEMSKATKTPKYVVKMAKNTFTNYHGEAKDNARQLIAQAIMLTKRQSSNILTLPAANWIMEKNILKQKSGYKFTAVEREKETFQQMIRNLTNDQALFDSVIGIENKTVGEQVVNDKDETYSSMILDYCGFIDSFYDEIDDIMNRNLVRKGGYIAITLSENDRQLNHSHHTSNYSNTYIQNCCVNEEVNGGKVTNDLINILVYNHRSRYKIVNKFPYKDKTAKMLLFIIKRIDE